MSLSILTRVRSMPIALVLCATAACGGESSDPEPAEESAPAEAPAQPTATIVEPADGAVLPAGDVRVVLAAENIAILPAGDTTSNSGHHHLVLNAEVPAVGEAIPAGQEGFVHLGRAQTEHTFTGLPAGEYTLVAVIGDLAHRVLPQVSDTVRFTVEAP